MEKLGIIIPRTASLLGTMPSETQYSTLIQRGISLEDYAVELRVITEDEQEKLKVPLHSKVLRLDKGHRILLWKATAQIRNRVLHGKKIKPKNVSRLGMRILTQDQWMHLFPESDEDAGSTSHNLSLEQAVLIT